MSLRGFVALMLLATLMAWGAWGMIVLNVSPYEAGLAGFLMFFSTLSIALVGTSTLALAAVRTLYLHRESVPSREIKIAFRHSILFTSVAVIGLLLSSREWVQTWHLLLLAAFACVVEYVMARFSQRRT